MNKKKEQPATWTVAMCSSEGDGIDMWRVFGRKEDVKKYMKRLSDDYCDGCDEETLPQKPEDIQVRQNGNLYSGPWGSDFHIDIKAKMEEFPENIIAGNKKAPEDGETASAFNLITADMSNWGHSCPMGIGATRDDDVAPICDYCDGTEDFIAFLERNAERISSSTELQFIIDSDETDRCLDAVKEIKKCFERLKEDSNNRATARIINSKVLAGYEDEFEHAVHVAAYKLLCDCTDGVPGLSYNEFEQAIYDNGTHNRFEQVAYDLFTELGHPIESDGTSF